MLSKRNIFLVLALVVIIGGFLRFYRLGEVSFVADEFLDMNASYGYFQTGTWQAWDFNLGEPSERMNVASDERAWIYRWQVAEIFHFIAPTEANARAVSALWGLVSIIAIYFAAYGLTKKKMIGLLSAALFAVSISGILMDRHLRMYAMFFPVFLGLAWALFRLLEGRYAGKAVLVRKFQEKTGLHAGYILPVFLIGLLSFHLHQLTANIILIAGAYVFVMGVLNFRKDRWNRYVIYFLSGIALLILAWVLVPGKLAVALGTLVFFDNHWSYLAIVSRDYSNAILASMFLLVGIVHLIKKEKLSKEGAWLAVSFFAPLLAAIFLWRRVVGEQYIFFIQSFEMILIAAGIYGTAIFLQENSSRYGRKIFWTTIIVSLLVLPNYTYFFQENNAYQQTSKSENPNYRSVFSVFFKKNKKPGDVLITRDFRNYYWSGQKVKTFDFGGELSTEKFNLQDLEKIMAENPSGWFIFSDNDKDYISEDAQKFAGDNLEKINAIAVRGGISVYRWGR
jgi:hypothetical protein